MPLESIRGKLKIEDGCLVVELNEKVIAKVALWDGIGAVVEASSNKLDDLVHAGADAAVKSIAYEHEFVLGNKAADVEQAKKEGFQAPAEE